MVSIDNHGLRALVSACRFCPYDECHCDDDLPEVRELVNDYLDPEHKLDQATINAICHGLDQNPHSHSFPVTTPGDEKRRDDGEFERATVDAFHAFRDQERDFLLNMPVGPLRHDDTTTTKWWKGTAHIRHHVEFLLVLKGVKPCVLFQKYDHKNIPTFSTIIIDILVPIMDRLGLWSYGFKISFESTDWVFYDTRSPLLPQISKIFLTDPSSKVVDNTGAYLGEDSDTDFLVPESEVAHALGYPIPFEPLGSGSHVDIQDKTEMDVLESRGRPRPHCCVYGTGFQCPVGDSDDWIKILTYYRTCEKAAQTAGTKLRLNAIRHDEMTDWLENNPGWLVGPDPWVGTSGPRLRAISD